MTLRGILCSASLSVIKPTFIAHRIPYQEKNLRMFIVAQRAIQTKYKRQKSNLTYDSESYFKSLSSPLI